MPYAHAIALPLLWVSAAHAGEPSDALDGAAAGDAVRVEMPSAFQRRAVLDEEAGLAVPDAIGIEMVLAQYGISVERAAVVQATRADGDVVIDWVELDDGSRSELTRARGGVVCSPASRKALWEGGAEIRVFAASPGAAEAVRAHPGLVMIEDHPHIGALVALAPGDQVTVRDVRRHGLLWEETVTIERPGGSLQMQRRELRERVCWMASRSAEP
ncbi:MAG: hypothetical protein ACOZNI_18715 [Myxococcota bacterium]